MFNTLYYSVNIGHVTIHCISVNIGHVTIHCITLYYSVNIGHVQYIVLQCILSSSINSDISIVKLLMEYRQLNDIIKVFKQLQLDKEHDEYIKALRCMTVYYNETNGVRQWLKAIQKLRKSLIAKLIS